MRIVNAVLKVVIPAFLSWMFVSYAFQEPVPFERIFENLGEFFPSFLITLSFVFPSLVLSYSLSKVLVFSRFDISHVGVFFSELPVVITATTLQIALWIWMFGITSKHSLFLDFLSSFIPSFFTFFAISFFQFYVKMRPVIFRILKSEFVRTMKSIGLDDRTSKRKLSKNVDLEFAPTLSYMVPILTGESLILENIYNFRGIGYEMIRSLNEFKGDQVISLVLYTAIVVVLVSEWARSKRIW